MKHILTIKNISYHSDIDVSQKAKRYIRMAKGKDFMNAGNQLLQTNNYGKVQGKIIKWDQQFELIFNQKQDKTIQFEIYEEHVFGFNQDQLLGVLVGQIKFISFDLKNVDMDYDVYDLKKNRLGMISISMSCNENKPVLRSKSNSEPSQQISVIQGKMSSIITVFSIITSLKDIINGRDCYSSIKVGSKMKLTSQIKKKSNDPIWVQTMMISRDSQQLMQFTIHCIDYDGSEEVVAKGTVNLNQIQRKKQVLSQRVQLTNNNNKNVGVCFLDIKIKNVHKKHQKTYQHSKIQIQSPEDQISQRIQKLNVASYVETSPKSSSKNLSMFSRKKYSPKISIILSNRSITMSKSQRFLSSSKGSPVAGYLNPFANNISDFNLKRKRHGNIGLGNKIDFTKQTRNNPGVGEYKLPSIFDRYT